MTKGISNESRELRRHLLSHNGPDVAKSMAESGYDDPVGLIIEMTDEVGKQLTYAALERQGMPRHEILELIASYCKNAIPTFKAVVTFDIAKKGSVTDIRYRRAESFCRYVGQFGALRMDRNCGSDKFHRFTVREPMDQGTGDDCSGYSVNHALINDDNALGTGEI